MLPVAICISYMFPLQGILYFIAGAVSVSILASVALYIILWRFFGAMNPLYGLVKKFLTDESYAETKIARMKVFVSELRNISIRQNDTDVWNANEFCDHMTAAFATFGSLLQTLRSGPCELTIVNANEKEKAEFLTFENRSYVCKHEDAKTITIGRKEN